MLKRPGTPTQQKEYRRALQRHQRAVKPRPPLVPSHPPLLLLPPPRCAAHTVHSLFDRTQAPPHLHRQRCTPTHPDTRVRAHTHTATACANSNWQFTVATAQLSAVDVDELQRLTEGYNTRRTHTRLHTHASTQTALTHLPRAHTRTRAH